jgi:hypothetical protein
VDLRAGLDDLEKRKFLTPPGLELRPLGSLSTIPSIKSFPGSAVVMLHDDWSMFSCFSTPLMGTVFDSSHPSLTISADSLHKVIQKKLLPLMEAHF